MLNRPLSIATMVAAAALFPASVQARCSDPIAGAIFGAGVGAAAGGAHGAVAGAILGTILGSSEPCHGRHYARRYDEPRNYDRGDDRGYRSPRHYDRGDDRGYREPRYYDRGHRGPAYYPPAAVYDEPARVYYAPTPYDRGPAVASRDSGRGYASRDWRYDDYPDRYDRRDDRWRR